MTAPIAIVASDGHRTLLKWHRARRKGSDPVFTGRRILEGMQAGASVEVDLVGHSDGGFAVLHDLTLDRMTTGTGAVRDATAAQLRGLHLRANDGTLLPEKVMLLEDLAGLLAGRGLHPEALLQLDFKEDAASLTPRSVETFAQALSGIASHFVLSSGDAEAVSLLAAATPGLRIGYDPCHMGAIARLKDSRDYAGFAEDALKAVPGAEWIYLDHDLVLFAADDGADLIAPFHAARRRVDCYTIRRADVAGVDGARRLLALRADQITTDDPEGLLAALS